MGLATIETVGVADKPRKAEDARRSVVVEGLVYDGFTAEPITKFWTVKGVWNPHSKQITFTDSRQLVESPDGYFRREVSLEGTETWGSKVGLRIEAERYYPEETPSITIGRPAEPFLVGLLPTEKVPRYPAPPTIHPPRPASEGPFAIELRAVDSDGKPIADAQARVFTHNEGYTWWYGSDDGRFRFRRQDLPNSGRTARYGLLIRAKGYAPSILKIDRPEDWSPNDWRHSRSGDDSNTGSSKIERTVTLRPGHVIQMRLFTADGEPVPDDLIPLVYFADYAKHVRIMRQPANKQRTSYHFDFELLSQETVETGTYRFHLPDEAPAFYVSIDYPGFLRAYDAGPFTAKEILDGRLNIRLPKPATLKVRFEPPDELRARLPYRACRTSAYRYDPPSGSSMYEVALRFAPETHYELTLMDLPPGDYNVSVSTVPKESHRSEAARRAVPGAFRDSRHITLEAGDSKEMHIEFVPFDPLAFRGPHSATLRIVDFHGQPAAGKSFRITYSVPHYARVKVLEGTVPEDGMVELKNVDRGRQQLDRPRDGRTHRPQYVLELDGKRIADFDLAEVGPDEVLELKRAPGINDPAPDFEMTDVFTGETLRLSTFRGQVVFLEFWATWCGPCQPEMVKLADLGRRRASSWKDRTVLLALSLDEDPEILRRHVRQRGWETIRHAWCGEGQLESEAARRYGIHGVPAALLIDPAGKIVWLGHPRDIPDLENRIDEIVGIQDSQPHSPDGEGL